jgi:DNA-binding NarL/FixJ family response regulator
MKETFSRPADDDSPASGRRRGSEGSKNGPKPRSPSGGERRLTVREKEILRLLAVGLGTSAIAHELSISPATVRNHAQRILAKLQVHSRLAAVARGYAAGLLPAPQWRSRPTSAPEPIPPI